jgi:hypothetical protein
MLDLPVLIYESDILQMTAQRGTDPSQILLAQLLLFNEFFFRQTGRFGFVVQLIDAFNALIIDHS